MESSIWTSSGPHWYGPLLVRTNLVNGPTRILRLRVGGPTHEAGALVGHDLGVMRSAHRPTCLLSGSHARLWYDPACCAHHMWYDNVISFFVRLSITLTNGRVTRHSSPTSFFVESIEWIQHLNTQPYIHVQTVDLVRPIRDLYKSCHCQWFRISLVYVLGMCKRSRKRIIPLRHPYKSRRIRDRQVAKEKISIVHRKPQECLRGMTFCVEGTTKCTKMQHF